MIRHDPFLELAAIAIDFELSAAERTRLEAHLATCQACLRAASALHADARSLATLPPVRLSERRADALLAGVLATPRGSLGSLRLLAVAALLVVLAVGGILVGAELLRRASDDDPLVVVPSPSASVDPDASASPVVPAATEPWSVTDLGAPGVLRDVTSGGPGLVAVGSRSEAPAASTVWTSTDGETWTAAPDQDSLELGAMVSVAAGPAGLVAVGRPESTFTEGSAIWTSADGRTWVGVAGPAFSGMLDLTTVVLFDGRYFAGGTVGDAGVITSDDGTSWQIAWQDTPPEVGPTDLSAAAGVTAMTAFDGGLAAAVWPGATIRLSADGATWRSVEGPETGAFVNDMAAWAGGLIAVGRDRSEHGAIWVSGEGAAWRRVADLGSAEPRGVTASGAALVVAAHTADGVPSITISTDGEIWSAATLEADIAPGTIAISLALFADGVVGVGGTGGLVTVDMRVAAWRGPRPTAQHASPSPPPGTSPSPATSTAPSATLATDATIGATWTRVDLPDDAVPATGGSMDGVIAGVPGAIAWGQVYGELSRVWTTADGRTWARATVEAPPDVDRDIEEPGFISSIAAGGPGYVAVGWYGRQDSGRRGVVWTSSDGRRWDLVPHDASFESVLISSVIAWRGELLAYGVRSFGPDEGQGEQLTWSSSDGLTWRSEPPSIPAGFRHGEPVVTEDRLWAAGTPADDAVALDWRQHRWLTSTDGREWSVADLPYYRRYLYPASGGLLTVIPPTWVTGPETAGMPTPGLYRSGDAASWQLVSEADLALEDLLEVGGTLIAVGDDSDADGRCPDACHPVGRRSVDGGVTWTKAAADDVNGTMLHVAALPDGTLVAVGRVFGEGAEVGPAAWVSEPD